MSEAAAPSASTRWKPAIAFGVAALLWLLLWYTMVRVAYPLGQELDQCVIREDSRRVAVELTWPSPRHTCVYERADGSLIRVHDYGDQVSKLAIGGLIGFGGAAVFLWLGFRRRDEDDSRAATTQGVSGRRT